MKRIIIVSGIIIALLVGCQAGKQPTPENWDMFGFNEMHQRYIDGSEITSNLKLKWKTTTGAAGESSPIIRNDGKETLVYFGSFGRVLHAINIESGNIKWLFETEDIIKSAAIDPKSKRLIAPVEPGVLNCIDVDTGKSIWAVAINTTLTAPTIFENSVYVGCRNKYVYCFDIDSGAELWRYKTDASVNSCVSVFGERVYFGSNDSNLYCLDKDSGELIWKFKTEGAIVSTPAIKDNKIYFGSYDKHFYCIDAEKGKLIWKYMTGAEIQSSAGLSPKYAIIPANDGYLYCLSQQTGEEKWVFDTGLWQPINNSPLITNSLVFFGATDGFVYCVDLKTGEKLWNYKTNDRIWSSAAGFGKYVVIGSNDGSLYCFEPDETIQE